MSAVAAIDIGSNSVRLLVVGPQGDELCREMNITRLAEGVDQSGRLAEVAMDRTLVVLERYGAQARQLGVSRLRVTGTSAARDATNRDAFFARVHAAVGSTPELLSGHAEAELAFSGATRGRSEEEGPFVTIDIGGGSTELAYGTRAHERSLSLDIGCVRITERFLAGSDPPRPAQFDAARALIESGLARADAEVRPRAAKTWLGLAGTVTSLAARAAGLRKYDPSVTHGYALSRDSVRSMHDELSRLRETERSRWLLEPKRASVILGGSIILVCVLEYFDLPAIIVSERDILDGLVQSLRAS
jgi:exopolyphosphatase / guanosine-5'-triphosphate,3'-diphosphate pyrophosphatase